MHRRQPAPYLRSTSPWIHVLCLLACSISIGCGGGDSAETPTHDGETASVGDDHGLHGDPNRSDPGVGTDQGPGERGPDDSNSRELGTDDSDSGGRGTDDSNSGELGSGSESNPGDVVVGDSQAADPSTRFRRGMSGIPKHLKTQPPLQSPLRTPSGRWVEAGQVDELGYKLPLDVVLYENESEEDESEETEVTPSTEPESQFGTDPTPRPQSRPETDRTESQFGTDPNSRPESQPETDLTESQFGTDRPARTRSPFDTEQTPLAAGSPFLEQRVSPDDGHTQNETSIDARGTTVVAGWNNYTDTTLLQGVARSSDSGSNWTTSILGGHSVTSDPAVRVSEDGTWYYAYLAGGGPGGSDIDIYVRRSTDDGITWSSPVDASQNGSFDDKPYIDARGSDVLVAWADFGFSPAKVHASRSTDGGLTYGQILPVSVVSNSGNGACPVIAPDGDYYVFWRDSFQENLWMARSSNQGTSWEADVPIVEMNPLPSSLPGGFRIINIPSADANPVDGTLLVVWNDQAFGNPDILAIRSTDDGATWSAPARINDDAGTGAQWFPWVDFDENGVAHAVWYDRRNDPSDIDVYYARSLDGGETWEENVRVTQQSFPVVLPWDTAVDFIGDYNGIAATADQAYPCYQDSRLGDQDIWVSAIPNATTSVDLPPGGSITGISWRVSPSPFTTTVRLDAWLDGSASGTPQVPEVDIVSARGRLVRRLAASTSGDGDPVPGRSPAELGESSETTAQATQQAARAAHRLTAEWDGRDRAGRSAPAGVYFARLRGRAGEAARIVKVR